MNHLFRAGALIVMILWAQRGGAQPLKASDEHFDDKGAHGHKTHQPKAKDALFDTEAHRVALTREIENERRSDTRLNVLRACGDVGIICGLELNSKMMALLNGFSQKRYTLISLFRGALGKEAEIEWMVPEYVWERQPQILMIKPKNAPTLLGRTIVWNVARSNGAKSDAYDLSKMAGLVAEPPKGNLALFGDYSYEQNVRMSVRETLNHIAATNKTSWQVVYSSANKIGKISFYPDN